ncbi:universal stress protein [Lentilactobacillus raoultii]|uniref:Universal stress protein n=1 Tax=Lentilactobacillus raoultii TaxID=1987503 RepID=A0ABW3PIQ6_9LACO|nr:universal stress protein [Lentilactobacillus raoultii]
MYQHILVPLDGSKNSQKALSVAITIAKTFSSKLTLLSVVDNRTLAVPTTTATPVNNAYTELKGYAQGIVDAGLKTVQENGLDADTIVSQGYPKSLIATDVPKEQNIDLIVIGKSGRGAVDRLLIGSTTAYVVRNATVQVLVVNDN